MTPKREVPRRIDKPWGHELIWADTEHYVGKILHVKSGHALSLQYHEEKDETMHVLRGRVQLEIGTSPDSLRPRTFAEGESIRLAPRTVHRLVAELDSDILEASTPHLDDVVRLEDRYGRA
jgi:mannose-6-phosphate isomerase